MFSAFVSALVAGVVHQHTHRYHMEPEWAAVELLDCIDNELDSGRDVEQRQQSSEAMFTAIRVLPAPEAGDLFVTCAARGDIGVVLFYFEEGGQRLFLWVRRVCPVQRTVRRYYFLAARTAAVGGTRVVIGVTSGVHWVSIPSGIGSCVSFLLD